MSRANPKKAVAALIPPGQAAIRPMTLGVYAALERIESPLVTNVPPKDTLDLIPSLYLLTHDPREVFRGNVLDLAMQWADTQPVGVVEEIRAARRRGRRASPEAATMALTGTSVGRRASIRSIRRRPATA